jgi:hypothetical protein
MKPGFYTRQDHFYFEEHAMTTLGQKLQDSIDANRLKGQYTPEQVAAQQARRVETVRASFARVTEKAKADIIKAVDKGHAVGDIKSQVPEREAAYGYLSHDRLRYLKYDPAVNEAVRPIWDAFLAWAASEQLDIWLQGFTQGEGREARQYVLIKARPLPAH